MKSTNTAVSDNLLKAMQNSRSIWETHEGSTAPRQRPSRKQTNGLTKNGCDDGEELGGVTEALGSTSIGDEASGDEDASKKAPWRVKEMPQFHYTSSEGLYKGIYVKHMKVLKRIGSLFDFVLTL